ncbi:hypothetical protein RCL1_001455 [Eukaryota sp. TZLM3-RCL]
MSARITIRHSIFDHCLFKLPNEQNLSWRSLSSTVERLAAKCQEHSLIIDLNSWTNVLQADLSISPLLCKAMFTSFSEFSDSFVSTDSAALPPLVLLLSLQTFFKASNLSVSPRAISADAWPKKRDASQSPEASFMPRTLDRNQAFNLQFNFISANFHHFVSLVFRVLELLDVSPLASMIIDTFHCLFFDRESLTVLVNSTLNQRKLVEEQILIDVIVKNLTPLEYSSYHYSIADLNKTSLIVRRSEVSPNDSVVISNCKKCFIVIMTSVASVVVSNCEQLTVFVGASKNVNITSSLKCTAVMTCRAIKIDWSSDVLSSVHCVLPPIVQPSTCHRLVFGPFNAFYPSLLADMQALDIPPLLPTDPWKEPISDPGVFAHEPTDSHIPFVVPFKDSDVDDFKRSESGKLLCTSCPVPLPVSYASEIKARAELFNSIRNLTVGLSKEEREKVEKAVHGCFSEWLLQSGRARVIHDLVSQEVEIDD